MILIVKLKNFENYFLVKLSPSGYGPECRLINLINNFECLDDKFIRKRLYHVIIDKLVFENKWNRDRIYNENDVSNTLHDWVVQCFKNNEIDIYFVEIDQKVLKAGN